MTNVPAFIKKIQVVALIAATIIVVVIVYISIQKEEIPGEQLKEEQVLIEEQLEEQVTPLVKIKSATATPIRCVRGGPDGKELIYCYCRVEMSGTATLLEDESLKFSACKRSCSVADSNWITNNKATCSSWWEVSWDRNCLRRSGQPATGEWSFSWEGDFFSRYDNSKMTFFALTDTKLGVVPDLSDHVWDSVILTCSP